MAEFKEQNQKERLESIKKKEAEDLTQILSQKYKLTYLDLSRINIELDALKILTEKEAREGEIAIFQKVGKKISVAVRNPEFPQTKQSIDRLKKETYEPTIFMVSEMSLDRAWSRYSEVPEFEEIAAGLISISKEHLAEYIAKITNINNFKELLTPIIAARQLRTASSMVEAILAGAYALEASDIHIEPQENETKLRFRLDGVLNDVINFPNNVYKLLLSRIKLIGEMKLNIADRPQDGRFTIRIEDTDVEVRASSLPGSYGESIVLRVLHPKAIGISFENLGIHDSISRIVEKAINKPNGMILTTGPTGSGKTTTLYAFIKKILSPEIKIITIENPVEYHIAGISQSQIDPSRGYDFADALRAIMRQDPDVILVGEIRDLATAKTALNAALTGHLVFSTLHTNNAFGTVPRLIDLGATPNIIGPAVSISIAQRLLRVLCKQCKKKVGASAEEIEFLKRTLAELPETIKKPSLDKIELWKAERCDACNNTGYKGRIGVYEAFSIDNEAQRLILKNPSESEYRKLAKRQNMITMEQDAALKILEGITSIEEMQRVLGE
ncbi:MAG: GspE/PulE family protein [Patescibacteria group bacterium]